MYQEGHIDGVEMQKPDADNIKELYEEVKDSINISAGGNTYENDK